MYNQDCFRRADVGVLTNQLRRRLWKCEEYQTMLKALLACFMLCLARGLRPQRLIYLKNENKNWIYAMAMSMDMFFFSTQPRNKARGKTIVCLCHQFTSSTHANKRAKKNPMSLNKADPSYKNN